MSSEPAIELRAVSKQYRIYRKPSDRLYEILFARKRHRIFNALQPFDLKIEKGEILGVIGKNGAGKSTLLGILSGTLTPTTGCVRVRGFVTSLLELGSGFHAHFTGRENVYLYARAMGMSKEEVTERMDSILRFADIGEFVDQPVRTYSGGMRLRMAFSATIHLDPDILLLDEVLAVGDAVFQRKCFERMRELMASRRKTFILVSHSLESVNTFCTRSLVLDQGKIVFDGVPKEGTNLYHSMLFSGPQQAVKGASTPSNQTLASEYRHGTGEALIERIEFLDSAGKPCQGLTTNASFSVRLHVRAVGRCVERPIYGIRIRIQNGVIIYGQNSARSNLRCPPLEPEHPQRIDFAMTAWLLPGHYFFMAGISEIEPNGEHRMMDHRMDAAVLTITGGDGNQGIVNLNAKILFPDSP